MSPNPVPDAASRIRSERPFSSWLELEDVEPVGAEFAHSGTAFFVTARDGRRFKLRDCRHPRRAAAIARWLRALPGVVPALVAHEGRYLLVEELADYRPVTRHELVRGAARLGRMSALAYRVGLPRDARQRLRQRMVALASHGRFLRDLALLRRSGTLPARSCAGAVRKYRAHWARFGLPIALELDDFHKGNVMIRPSDGDLRYVDEEGIALRPRGTGMASFLKTVTGTRALERYREGYGELADPGFITPPYVEYLLLMDGVRRVAFKVRTEGRLEKLPREVGELRQMTDRPGLSLAWRFPRG